jgi:hypothetical protein
VTTRTRRPGAGGGGSLLGEEVAMSRPSPQFAAMLALATALACGGPGAEAPRPPDRSRIATAHPEPDPACRSTVQEVLARSGMNQVVVTLAVDPVGAVQVRDFLTADLTAAEKEDLRRAFAGCIWTPAATASGAGTWMSLIARDRAERGGTPTPQPPPAPQR